MTKNLFRIGLLLLVELLWLPSASAVNAPTPPLLSRAYAIARLEEKLPKDSAIELYRIGDETVRIDFPYGYNIDLHCTPGGLKAEGQRTYSVDLNTFRDLKKPISKDETLNKLKSVSIKYDKATGMVSPGDYDVIVCAKGHLMTMFGAVEANSLDKSYEKFGLELPMPKALIRRNLQEKKPLPPLNLEIRFAKDEKDLGIIDISNPYGENLQSLQFIQGNTKKMLGKGFGLSNQKHEYLIIDPQTPFSLIFTYREYKNETRQVEFKYLHGFYTSQEVK